MPGKFRANSPPFRKTPCPRRARRAWWAAHRLPTPHRPPCVRRACLKAQVDEPCPNQTVSAENYERLCRLWGGWWATVKVRGSWRTYRGIWGNPVYYKRRTIKSFLHWDQVSSSNL